MGKFKIKQNPTFSADVSLPVVGGEAVVVKFEFKWKNREELAAFHDARLEWARSMGEIERGEGMVSRMAASAIAFETEQLRDIVCGWEIEDEFNDENLVAFVKSNSELPAAVVDAYFKAVEMAREKN